MNIRQALQRQASVCKGTVEPFQRLWVGSWFFKPTHYMVTGAILTLLTACQSNRTPMFVPANGSYVNSAASKPSIVKDPAQAAHARTAIAAEYIRKGELDAAKRSLEAALESDSRSVEAYIMMGVLLQTEGSEVNLRKAESYFKKAISLKPDDAQAHNNYGVYLAFLKRYPEAIGHFSIAGSTLGYEGRANALENLGRTLLLVKDVPRATTAFEQALNANRDLIVPRFELADIFLKQGRAAQADALYQDYITMIGQPDAASLWLGMRIAHALHQEERVTQYADQLQQHFPNSDEFSRYTQLKQAPGTPWI